MTPLTPVSDLTNTWCHDPWDKGASGKTFLYVSSLANSLVSSDLWTIRSVQLGSWNQDLGFVTWILDSAVKEFI